MSDQHLGGWEKFNRVELLGVELKPWADWCFRALSFYSLLTASMNTTFILRPAPHHPL